MNRHLCALLCVAASGCVSDGGDGSGSIVQCSAPRHSIEVQFTPQACQDLESRGWPKLLMLAESPQITTHIANGNSICANGERSEPPQGCPIPAITTATNTLFPLNPSECANPLGEDGAVFFGPARSAGHSITDVVNYRLHELDASGNVVRLLGSGSSASEQCDPNATTIVLINPGADPGTGMDAGPSRSCSEGFSPCGEGCIIGTCCSPTSFCPNGATCDPYDQAVCDPPGEGAAFCCGDGTSVDCAPGWIPCEDTCVPQGDGCQ